MLLHHATFLHNPLLLGVKVGFCCYIVATLSALITLINLSENIGRGKSSTSVDNHYQCLQNNFLWRIRTASKAFRHDTLSNINCVFLTLTEPFRNVFEFTKYSIQQPEQKTMVSYFVERFLLGRAKLAEICFWSKMGRQLPLKEITPWDIKVNDERN